MRKGQRRKGEKYERLDFNYLPGGADSFGYLFCYYPIAETFCGTEYCHDDRNLLWSDLVWILAWYPDDHHGGTADRQKV